MKCNDNKNINKENQKNIEDIYTLLKNLNNNQLDLVRNFARGLMRA